MHVPFQVPSDTCAPCAAPPLPDDLPVFVGVLDAGATGGFEVQIENADDTITPVALFEGAAFDFRGPVGADLNVFQSGVQLFFVSLLYFCLHGRVFGLNVFQSGVQLFLFSLGCFTFACMAVSLALKALENMPRVDMKSGEGE